MDKDRIALLTRCFSEDDFCDICPIKNIECFDCEITPPTMIWGEKKRYVSVEIRDGDPRGPLIACYRCGCESREGFSAIKHEEGCLFSPDAVKRPSDS